MVERGTGGLRAAPIRWNLQPTHRVTRRRIDHDRRFINQANIRQVTMWRRALIGGGLMLPVVLGASRIELSDAADRPAPAANSGAFDPSVPREMARALASKPYKSPDNKIPDVLARLTYDQYRSIRFNPARALWRDEKLPFQAQFFHRGFFYTDRVEIFEVADGRANLIRYNPDLFDMGQVPTVRAAADANADNDIGFAGFRVHAPINRPDYYDEVCVFLGASYFRAVAKGQVYGQSARGLSIKTADPGGEEFPAFRRFWLERPSPDASAMIVHALLDSQSATACFRFTLRPGQETIFDIESTIFPRVDIDQAGIATLTSMFDFDPSDRNGVDDYRIAVHDTNGLQVWTGRGEQIWRQLANPKTLQISSFIDTRPRGFGLMQRARNFSAYDDLESHYEKRPSVWIEPIGDVGDGAVYLVEIPTKREIDDNVVAFWRPKEKLQAKGEYAFTYRQHWCWDPPGPPPLVRVAETRAGIGSNGKTRLFVLECNGDALKGLPPETVLTPDVSAKPGKILNPVAQPNPETGGWRMSFELDPGGEKAIELRAVLTRDKSPVSETWLYRWTS
jgi:periplasmic glucans biosynthesis protein